MAFAKYVIRNKLLRALDDACFEALWPAMDLIKFDLGSQLAAQNERQRRVLFIESGVASIRALTLEGRHVETGQIGSEGMLGLTALLAAAVHNHAVIAHSKTTAISLPAKCFMEACDSFPAMRDLIFRYLHLRELQLTQFSISNLSNRLSVRLARWLLMCQDRLETDDLPVTHAFLASILGVRRAGITNELHILEGLHVVRPTRGNVRILDRPALMEIAGAAYGVPEEENRRLIPDHGQHRRDIAIAAF